MQDDENSQSPTARRHITFADGSHLSLTIDGEDASAARQWLWLVATWIDEHEGVPPIIMHLRSPEMPFRARTEGHDFFLSFDCARCDKPATGQKQVPGGEPLHLCVDCMIVHVAQRA